LGQQNPEASLWSAYHSLSSLLPSQGLDTQHSHWGSHSIGSVAGNLSPTTGGTSYYLPTAYLAYQCCSLGECGPWRQNKGDWQQVPGNMPAPRALVAMTSQVAKPKSNWAVQNRDSQLLGCKTVQLGSGLYSWLLGRVTAGKMDSWASWFFLCCFSSYLLSQQSVFLPSSLPPSLLHIFLSSPCIPLPFDPLPYHSLTFLLTFSLSLPPLLIPSSPSFSLCHVLTWKGYSRLAQGLPS
jgi:hypothetical protein